MASASTTPNLNLPQWVGTEKSERTDFNAAFDAIDTTVASHLAEIAADDVHGLAFKGANLKKSTNQSVAPSTITFVTWSGVNYDTDSFYNAANPTRLTVPSGVSKVRLHANLKTGGVDGRKVLEFYKNGSENVAGGCKNDIESTGNICSGIVSGVLFVNEGDYFEVMFYHTDSTSKFIYSLADVTFGIEVVE